MTYKIWTVLKSGGEYTVEHVKWLQKHTDRIGYELNVLTDESLVHIAPFEMLRFNYPGWWSKMELFAPGFEESQDIVFCDLDTVLLNKFDYIFEHEGTVLLRDTFRMGRCIQSCFMKLTYEDRLKVWDYWSCQSDDLMQKYRRGGDQLVVEDVLTDKQMFQDLWRDKLQSFKFTAQGNRVRDIHNRMLIKPDADIVIFSGRPRPWDLKRSWIDSL